MKIKIQLPVLFAVCFLLAACSKSPSKVVTENFEYQKNLDAAQVRVLLEQECSNLYQLYYDDALYETDNEEEAKAIADEKIAQKRDSLKKWTDIEFEREARRRREVYNYAKIKILSESVTSDKKSATVEYSILYNGGVEEKRTAKLRKDSDGKWQILPEEPVNKTPAAEEEEDYE